ncbi:MAG TPA: universal stress protein [Methanomassiliicoccales archaeon]|nr:universal stress protein [Methanomassiliicoccales archaeon]
MMPFKKILLTTDGSDYALAAAIQGLDLAKLMDADVTVMSIIDEGSDFAIRGFRRAAVEGYTYLDDKAKEAVDLVAKEAEKRGMSIMKIVKRGVPANEIIDASKDYDLVIMSSLGHTGLAHFLMGGVAEKVVRFASCPVLLVRPRGIHK